jgi:5'-deoxynucleotidase YfbR-like HD superfamily hydrolase
METYTGGMYWPCDPRVDEVHPLDVAHALSNLCRFGGHARRFYSVAEHAILMCDYVRTALGRPREDCLLALVHDAAEAYTGDVPRPLKRSLQRSSVDFCDMLTRNELVVAQRFGVPHELPDWLREVDDRIVSDEREQVMDTRRINDWWEHPKGKLGVELQFWTPMQAEVRFLKRLKQLEA